MGGSRGGVRSALGEAETGERSARQQKGKWEPALPRIGARGGRSGQRVGSGAPGRTRRSSTGAPAARRRQCRRRGTDLPPGRQTRARGFTGAQKQLCNRRGVDREGSRARQIGRATRWAQRRRGDGERARGGGGGGRHPRAGELPALATPWRGSALPAPPSPPPKSPAGSYTTLDWGARARAPGSTAPRASVAPPWGAPHGLDAGSACNFPRGGGGCGGTGEGAARLAAGELRQRERVPLPPPPLHWVWDGGTPAAAAAPATRQPQGEWWWWLRPPSRAHADARETRNGCGWGAGKAIGGGGTPPPPFPAARPAKQGGPWRIRRPDLVRPGRPAGARGSGGGKGRWPAWGLDPPHPRTRPHVCMRDGGGREGGRLCPADPPGRWTLCLGNHLCAHRCRGGEGGGRRVRQTDVCVGGCRQGQGGEAVANGSEVAVRAGRGRSPKAGACT